MDKRSFGQQSRCSPYIITRLEEGKPCKPDTLAKIASVFGVTTDVLLGETSYGVDKTILEEFESWCNKTGRVPSRYHTLALWLVQRVVPECMDEAITAMDEGRETFVRLFSAAEEVAYKADYDHGKALLEQIPEPIDKSHKDAG